MSVHASNVSATVENFDASEINLEQRADPEEGNDVLNDQEEIMNIGEFVFNHITAEVQGSICKSIRRKIALNSKILIKVCTSLDVSMYICFLFMSLFLLIQKNSLIRFELNWLVYVSLITTFLQGIICIWILKLIIEAGYEYKIYMTYIIYRAISTLVIFFMIAGICLRHLIAVPEGMEEPYGDILKYYCIVNFVLVTCGSIYIVISTIIYSFHCSVVKEFYKIVSIIVEAQNQEKKMKNDMEI